MAAGYIKKKSLTHFPHLAKTLRSSTGSPTTSTAHDGATDDDDDMVKKKSSESSSGASAASRSRAQKLLDDLESKLCYDNKSKDLEKVLLAGFDYAFISKKV